MKAWIFALAALGCSATGAIAQGGFNPQAQARDALSQPFSGITTGGTVRRGLYPIQETGVSVQPVIDAARAFLAALDDKQQALVSFTVDDNAWRNWANIHRFPREGLSLEDMSPEQRDHAHALLQASLSAKGYRAARDIMRLNHHLAELVANFEDYGEHLYWFAVFGDPAPDEPWGWQIEGHHLIVNYFVIGDQIVMTPTFMGSEPISANSGKYAGTAILNAEQEQALRLMQSLSTDQQKVARLGDKQGRSENLAEMFKDNITIPYRGLAAADMTPMQRDGLMGLAALFVRNLRDGYAAVKMTEVEAHLDETHFAWIGDTDEDAVFYYRIHSPVILIEFDHQGPIALDGDRSKPTRRHIHTVVRTPNGNDYGRDLLHQHYDATANDPNHRHR